MDEKLHLAGIGRVLSRFFNLDGLLLEQFDEEIANDLTLRLRVAYALEALKKYRRPVNDGQVDTEMLLERLLHLLAFIETHHPVIHKNCVKSVT